MGWKKINIVVSSQHCLQGTNQNDIGECHIFPQEMLIHVSSPELCVMWWLLMKLDICTLAVNDNADLAALMAKIHLH